jgi:hypothetical protein
MESSGAVLARAEASDGEQRMPCLPERRPAMESSGCVLAGAEASEGADVVGSGAAVPGGHV